MDCRMASPAPTSAQTATTAPATAIVPSAPSSAPAPAEIPPTTTLIQAARLSLQQDKPIALDYYHDTANNKAFIGEDPDTKEKVLVKSRDEFTSFISKLYKVGDDFLITTENTIYICSGKIQKRKVNMASLQASAME